MTKSGESPSPGCHRFLLLRCPVLKYPAPPPNPAASLRSPTHRGPEAARAPAAPSASSHRLCACATGKFAKVPEAEPAVSGSRQPPQPSDPRLRQWGQTRPVLLSPGFGPDLERWGKEMALLCYNRGCGQRFDPENNSDGKRSAPPAFPSFSPSAGGTPLRPRASRVSPRAVVVLPRSRPLRAALAPRPHPERSVEASDPLPAAAQPRGPISRPHVFPGGPLTRPLAWNLNTFLPSLSPSAPSPWGSRSYPGAAGLA